MSRLREYIGRLLRGAGSISLMSPRSKSRWCKLTGEYTGPERDYDAIEGAWRAVGDDLEKAMQELEKQKQGER